jgi:hypothetical protein
LPSRPRAGDRPAGPELRRRDRRGRRPDGGGPGRRHTPAHLDPDLEAVSLLAISAGLSTSVIAGHSNAGQAQAVIDYHLYRMFPASRPALCRSTTHRPPRKAMLQPQRCRRHGRRPEAADCSARTGLRAAITPNRAICARFCLTDRRSSCARIWRTLESGHTIPGGCEGSSLWTCCRVGFSASLARSDRASSASQPNRRSTASQATVAT